MPLRHSRVLSALTIPATPARSFMAAAGGRKTIDGKLSVEKVPPDQWTALIRELQDRSHPAARCHVP